MIWGLLIAGLAALLVMCFFLGTDKDHTVPECFADGGITEPFIYSNRECFDCVWHDYCLDIVEEKLIIRQPTDYKEKSLEEK